MSQIANGVGRLSLDSDADSQPPLSSQEPFQTAPAPDSAQLIRLLEHKLAAGSDAGISLSVDDARELVRALRSPEDASERLREVEQELVEAKQELQEFRFFSKYGDYAGKVWNDIHLIGCHELPKTATETQSCFEALDGKTMDSFESSAEKLSPPLSYRAARCALRDYSHRCQKFHSRDVYYANEKDIVRQADSDLAALVTCLPGNRSASCLEDWKAIINYVRCSRGPQEDKKGAASLDQVTSSRRSKFMPSQSPQFFVDLVMDGTLPRSATSFLIDRGVFVASPEAPGSSVSRSRRAQSAPPSGTRKRKRPADLDGASYAPFSRRRDIGPLGNDQANETPAEANERQKLSSVKNLL
ncbi:hypothetical protein FDECE_17761 [Fusarium decemcellulare]|nr:hypothetical protein FDECE_17761 [Fusarium decemcellulare]